MRLASALPPGSVIGILGGGQLARMLALAAAPLGLKCHIFAPERDRLPMMTRRRWRGLPRPPM
jgi:phosphoribosylaminoimidazole carboxylase (NCAIR synthetase)